MSPEVSPSSFNPSTSFPPPPLPFHSHLSLLWRLSSHPPRSGRNPRTQRKTPPASPPSPLVREIRKTRVISHRGRTEHVSLGGEGRGAAAYDRCVWVSGLWGFEEREGTFYFLRHRTLHNTAHSFQLDTDPPRPLQTSLQPLPNPFSQRISALITHIRTTLRHGVYHPQLYVVKEDGDDQALKMRALSAMVYDRSENALPSYGQWVGQLRDKVSGGW